MAEEHDRDRMNSNEELIRHVKAEVGGYFEYEELDDGDILIHWYPFGPSRRYRPRYDTPLVLKLLESLPPLPVICTSVSRETREMIPGIASWIVHNLRAELEYRLERWDAMKDTGPT